MNIKLKNKNLLESGLVDSGNETTITRYGLIDGQYKWRARAIDDKGNASDWQEFGEKGQTVLVSRPINASNALIICSACGKATKVAFRKTGEMKERICKKCGAKI